jgi:hypothetical protein
MQGLRSAGGAVLLGRRCSNGASARPGRGPPPAPRRRSPTSAVGGMGSGSRIRPGGDGGAVEGRTGGAQPRAAPPLRLPRPGQQLPAPTRQQGAPLGRLLDPSRGDSSATCAAPLTQDGGHEDRKQPPALRRQLRRPRHREVQDYPHDDAQQRLGDFNALREAGAGRLWGRGGAAAAAGGLPRAPGLCARALRVASAPAAPRGPRSARRTGNPRSSSLRRSSGLSRAQRRGLAAAPAAAPRPLRGVRGASVAFASGAVAPPSPSPPKWPPPWWERMSTATSSPPCIAQGASAAPALWACRVRAAAGKRGVPLGLKAAGWRPHCQKWPY